MTDFQKHFVRDGEIGPVSSNEEDRYLVAKISNGVIKCLTKEDISKFLQGENTNDIEIILNTIEDSGLIKGQASAETILDIFNTKS